MLVGDRLVGAKHRDPLGAKCPERIAASARAGRDAESVAPAPDPVLEGDIAGHAAPEGFGAHPH